MGSPRSSSSTSLQNKEASVQGTSRLEALKGPRRSRGRQRPGNPRRKCEPTAAEKSSPGICNIIISFSEVVDDPRCKLVKTEESSKEYQPDGARMVRI